MPEAATAASTSGVGGRLMFTDDPDPRVLQGVFSLMLALDLGLRYASGTDVELISWPARAFVLAVVVQVVTFVVPWQRWDGRLAWVLPVIDIGLLGMSRLTPQTGAAAALIVVPAYWLGRQYGRRGALGVLVASLLLLAMPSLIHLGVGDGNLSRSLLLPVVAAWAALALAMALERMEAQRREADHRGQALSEALDTIAQQQRFADAILDTVDVGLVLLDETGAYQGMNRRHEDFMRLAYPDGHAGRAGQVGQVFGEDAQTPLATVEMPTWRAAHGEEFDDCRIWVGDDPLTRRALSVSARTVRDAQGHFAGAALAYKDVTDFMRALRVKDEFVASVSHELRTPLTSIVGYVDLLLDEELPDDQRTQLEIVSRNTDRLRRLVADLLHTAQADEGPLHIVRTPCDLAEIVRECVAAASPGARSAGVVLDSDLPESLPATLDAQRVAQVVDNLISNAVKYTPRGGEVCVELGIDANRIELAVSDTGIGIDPVDRDRLFTRFFRARQAEERSIQGVGLGLSIVQSIVESHGGRIEVESVLGKGSCFRVRLPRE